MGVSPSSPLHTFLTWDPLSTMVRAVVCVMCCVSQPLQSMPPSQVHCAGCAVPAGSSASSMPEEKIVSFVPVSVFRPGGGLEALTLLQQEKEVERWK